jgi:hypothetical protein
MPSDEDLETGRLLPSNVTVHNRPAQRLYVFGQQHGAAAAPLEANREPGAEAIEMQDLNPGKALTLRRGRQQPFNGKGPQFTREPISVEEELSYILHQVESHHTLAGIALQYRVTVGHPPPPRSAAAFPPA